MIGVGRGGARLGECGGQPGLLCVWIMGRSADLCVAGTPGVMWNEAVTRSSPLENQNVSAPMEPVVLVTIVTETTTQKEGPLLQR